MLRFVYFLDGEILLFWTSIFSTQIVQEDAYFERHFIHMYDMEEMGKENEGLKIMCAVIMRDLRRFNKMHSDEKAKRVGLFVYFKRGLYIYRHTFHFTFSSTMFTHLYEYFALNALKDTSLKTHGIYVHIRKHNAWPRCKKHSDHKSLDPFFYSDDFLQEWYEEIASDDHSAAQELERVKKRCECMKEAFSKSEFTSIYYHSTNSVYNWDENDWTKRLVIALQTYTSSPVLYTANMGRQFLSLVKILYLQCLYT